MDGGSGNGGDAAVVVRWATVNSGRVAVALLRLADRMRLGSFRRFGRSRRSLSDEDVISGEAARGLVLLEQMLLVEALSGRREDDADTFGDG
jgi:hypothetical protein